MANFLAPRGIDLSHYNYVVMDGLYYSFLYIKAGGYPSRVRAGWMSSLINAGEGVDIDVHLRRENRSRTIDKVAQRIRLNRTKLKSMQDTSTDYEELTNSIQAGYFIKNGIANYNEDLFYMSVFITVTGNLVSGKTGRSASSAMSVRRLAPQKRCIRPHSTQILLPGDVFSPGFAVCSEHLQRRRHSE